MIFLGYLAAFVIVVILALIVIWFAMGAMHQHLRNKGEGFGRDEELHAKVNELLEDKRNAAIATKH